MFPVETHGAVDVIKPAVPINQENVAQLHATVAGMSHEGQPMVVLDLSQVPLLDSAGLEALLDLDDAMRGLGGSLKLASLSPLCEDTLRISGVAQRFELYPDAKAAVRSFVR